MLVPDLKAIGLDEVIYNRENGFVIGTLNANTDEKAPSYWLYRSYGYS